MKFGRLAVAEFLVGKRCEKSSSFSSTASIRCGARLSTVKGPATRMRAVSGIGLVIEIFVVRLGGDGGVDLLLPGDARFPPFGVLGRGVGRPILAGLARNFPLFPCLAEGGVEPGAERFESLLPLLDQITSISALLAMDFRVMWGTRS